MPLTRGDALKIMLAPKGMLERSHYGMPSVFYQGVFVGRVHDKEGAVVLHVGSIEMRDVMLEAEPALFFITDHYRAWPTLLARLPKLDKASLKGLIAARLAEIDARKKPKRAAKQLLRKKRKR